MKILETDQGWTLEHNGKSPIAIEGESYFTDKAVLEAAIEKRALHIWSDGSIEKTPEPKDSSGAPPTEDPPTDPNAQPDDPDPNPVSPEPVTTKPKKARGGKLPKLTPEKQDEMIAALGGNGFVLSPQQIDALGGPQHLAYLAKVAKVKPKKDATGQVTYPNASDLRALKLAHDKVAAEDKEAALDPTKPRRGRPPKYSPEEAERRRKDQAKRYAVERTPEQKALARERARRWRENNPGKVKEARQKSIEKRTERYQTDPEFRTKVNEYQRSYKKTKRGVSE